MMQNQLIVGVMGGGMADRESAEAAFQLGSLIASQGWILLNGGRNAGVMAASARGAREMYGGLLYRLHDGLRFPRARGEDSPIPN